MQSFLAAIEERGRVAGSARDDWGASAAASAVAMYWRLERTGEATSAAAVPLSHIVRSDAAAARLLAGTDPASPGLERRCSIHLTELGMLIAIFALNKCKEYDALCSAQKSFFDEVFNDGVAVVWQLVRPQTARARPPTIPRNPPNDNREYYTLRKTEPKRRTNNNECQKDSGQKDSGQKDSGQKDSNQLTRSTTSPPPLLARPTKRPASLSHAGSTVPNAAPRSTGTAPR